MNHCVSRGDAIKVLDDGNDWYNTGTRQKIGTLKTRDLIMFATTPDGNQLRFIIMDKTSLALTHGPITVDASTGVDSYGIFGGEGQTITVLFNDRSAPRGGFRKVYNYQGSDIGGARKAWRDDGVVPEYMQTTQLLEDPSIFIGVFYFGNRAYVGDVGDAKLQADVLDSLGNSLGPPVDISPSTTEAGSQSWPWAVCPYKFDDDGDQMGFFLVYTTGSIASAVFMDRYAGSLSDAKVLTYTDGGIGPWSCCETYDHNYLIVGWDGNDDDYYIWVLDRDLNILQNREQLHAESGSASPFTVTVMQNGDGLSYSVIANDNPSGTSNDLCLTIEILHTDL